MNTFQSQYFCFTAYTGNSENRENSDLSRESTHFDFPTSRQAAVNTLPGLEAEWLTLSGPLIERTEMKRKIYLSEAWILLWIRLKSPDVGPERVKELIYVFYFKYNMIVM